MATNFTFGQDISGAVGNTLNRNQQNRQFMLNLAEEMKRRAFNQKIQELSVRMQRKQNQLQQEKFDHQIIQDAIANDLQRKRNEKLNQVAEAQAANLQSLADTRGNKSGQQQPSQGAVNINLSSVTRQLEDKKERANQLSSAIRKIHDTGVVPEEMQGSLLETTDPTQALFALSAENVRLKSDIDRLEGQRQSLNQASGISPEVAGGSERQSTDRGIKELRSKEDFAELRDNQMFTVPGQEGTFRKVNGEIVRAQAEDRSELIAPNNRGF